MPDGTSVARSRLVWMVVLVITVLSALLLVVFLAPRENGSDGFLTDDNTSRQNTSRKEPSDEYASLRQEMVRKDIKARGVTDPLVLSAMERVPRQEFVPEEMRAHAYIDDPLPIGYGQTISQPYIVAVMTEALELQENVSRALEIGTGSGYQAAVLAEICAEVHSVEIVSPLATRASTTLRSLGYGNVHVKNADGYFGWDEHAPYDAIIITCAASHIPPRLVDQLADGGRLILPLGSPYTWQTLTILEKTGEDTTLRYMFQVVFVPMTGEIESR